jgi:ATP-dependent helicase/nuclease subunit A
VSVPTDGATVPSPERIEQRGAPPAPRDMLAHASRRGRALTSEQEQAAARRGGSLLLAAGAGSGKTSVLVERFVRAVCEDGVAPGAILAITFTERAAAELRARVRAQLLELGEREAARDMEGAPIGTFHGFCARLLRIHALPAGLDPDFEILDEAAAGRLRLRAFRHTLAALLAEDRPVARREEAVELLASYGADRVRGMVLRVYAEERSRGVDRPRLPAARSGQAPPESEQLELRAIRACALLGEALEFFGHRYAELKRARGALDFDDLELCARDLLAEHPGVRAAWRERLELLMVDEFQDTNRRQLELLELLERENLFTVGDELQSIYGFRHAEVEIFRARRRRLREAGGALVLARNFRSRPPLIAAVNTVFGERLGEACTPLVPAREDTSTGEPLIELLLTDRRGWAESPYAQSIAGELPPAPIWRQAEARLLAQRVAELVASGAGRAGEVAVLLRAVGDLPVYERALQERGLRTLAAVGSFWGHQQIGDLLAWLRALANPLDELALYSTLASPLVGLSSDGLALLAQEAARSAPGTSRIGVWATIAREDEALYARLPSGDRERLAGFAERFASERRTAPMHSIAELLLRAIVASDYERHVLSLNWGERRLANVHKLLRLARRFEAAEGRDLRGFLDHVAHRELFAEGSEPHAPVAGSEPDAVRLMTIHAAKGLEFPIVCVADLGRTGNGTPPDLLLDGERLGLRLASLDGTPSVGLLQYEALCEERRQREAAEEERILYVAMTRARERLLLSGAVEFARWPADRPGGAPIAWLGPALAAEVPAAAGTLERPLMELNVGGPGGARMRCLLSAPGSVGVVLREDSLRPSRAPLPAVASAVIEPDGAAPRAAGESPPLRQLPLSYTALTQLERCGYRYYLEHVLGLPENRAAAHGETRRRDGLGARARGVLVHRLLESLDFARPALPTSREVDGVARRLGVSVAPGERDEIVALVGAAASTTLAARLAAARQVHREHRFSFPLSASSGIGGQLVSGVIDLLAVEADGGWLIVDYKSDGVAEHDDLAELVEREYGTQRLLYALAALHGGATSVEVVHWFLERPDEWIAARFEAGDRPRLAGELLELAGRISARGLSVSETPHRALCLTCPGRARLCSWNEAETLGERPAAKPGDRSKIGQRGG